MDTKDYAAPLPVNCRRGRPRQASRGPLSPLSPVWVVVFQLEPDSW
jgi:hypothetical protein